MSQDSETSAGKSSLRQQLRFDLGYKDGTSCWIALSQTPGVGVSITDSKGRLLFVNDTSLVLFSGRADIDYAGKTIADFHSPEFVEERLALIQRVIKDGNPLRMKHIYNGRPVDSTIWPFRDKSPPYNRVLVVSRSNTPSTLEELVPSDIEVVESKFIHLGPLEALSKRELEVLVLLGNGLSVPRTASILNRSPKTIERHKTAIGRKLALRGQNEIVYIATSIGLDMSDVKLERLSEPSL